MSDVAVKTEGLSKAYKLGLAGPAYGSLRESLSNAFKFTRKGGGDAPEVDTLWALDDVSIEIRQGEVVGLIGHNGAGKSTLLKILSRIVEPSRGYADITGRAGSLLEVGTGFHPELTGRENIFLNGAILGMRREEIRLRFDEIVEFADMGRFLDTPVKRYSSGMSVRLAFAVAAHLEPEILLVDEVLAVGDAAFQKKSLAKMNEVASEGRTVVFVSHNLAIIQALCQRGIFMERGRVLADAPIAEAVNEYLGTLERAAVADLLERTDRDSGGWQQTKVRRCLVRDTASGQADVVVGGRAATIEVEVTEVLPPLECHLTIVNSLGHPVVTFDSQLRNDADRRGREFGQTISCEVESLPLIPGRYRIDVSIRGSEEFQDGLPAAGFFDVEPGVIEGRPMPPEADGDVVLRHRWQIPEP
jgi:lipopolysaccharide transport system ATP-binding protein